jgi:hypothetical protein
MKQFVTVELEAQSKFIYPSERKTSGMNMGQIVQIAFELRNLTQAALDDESSGSDHEEALEVSQKSVWMKFCKEKIEKIEKVWNRKLEDGDDQGEDQDALGN